MLIYDVPNYPDNIAEAAHQRAGSGSCGHPRRSRQRTGGESANWLCSGPAPAEPSLPPPCQHRAGSGPAPAPDSAGASRIAAGLCPPHLSSIVISYFLFIFLIFYIFNPPLNARVLLLLHGNTCILHVQLLPTLSKAWAFKAEIKAFKSRKHVHFYVCVCVIFLFFYCILIHYINRKKCDYVPGLCIQHIEILWSKYTTEM